MPLTARVELLCEPKIDAIRQWIDEGAKVE
jgi:hypothetical protein